MTNQEKVVLNRMIEMMEKLQGFEKTVLKDLSSLNKSLRRDLKTSLKKEVNKSYLSKQRTLAVLNETEITLNSISAMLAEKTAQSVVNAGEYSFSTMNKIVSWDGKVKGFNNVALSKEELYTLATKNKLSDKTLKQWVSSAITPDIESLKTEIKKGYIKGEGYKKTVNKLIDDLGLIKGSKNARDLETVAITYIQSINATAQQSVFKANSAVVKQVQWSAIMENGNTKTGKGTCPRCMALDGMRWDLEETDRPNHPLHARCRCMLLPITKTWKDMGFDVEEMNSNYRKWYERDEKGNILNRGETNKTYGEWWKEKGKEGTKGKIFQNNAVGPTRANLLRDGFIEFGDLVDYENGDLVLLKDLYQIIGGNPYEVTKAAVEIEGKKFGVSGVENFYNATPSYLKTTDHDFFFKADSGYTVEKISPDGAFYQHSSNLINMDLNEINASNAVTFLHEFGHRIDYFYGERFAKKWGGNGRNVTATNAWNAALSYDNSLIRGIEKAGFKTLGGVGRYSLEKSKVLHENVIFDIVDGLKTNNLKEGIPELHKLAKKELKGDYEKFYKISNTFIEKKRIAESVGEVQGNDILESNAIISLLAAQRSGSDRFILKEWLEVFNNFTRPNVERVGLCLADSIEGSSKAKLGFGHGASYYNRPGARGKEVFANMNALHGDENSRAFFERFMPNQFEIFNQFLKEVKK